MDNFFNNSSLECSRIRGDTFGVSAAGRSAPPGAFGVLLSNRFIIKPPKSLNNTLLYDIFLEDLLIFFDNSCSNNREKA